MSERGVKHSNRKMGNWRLLMNQEPVLLHIDLQSTSYMCQPLPLSGLQQVQALCAEVCQG